MHSLEEVYLRLIEDVELDNQMLDDPILRMEEEEASHE